MTDTNLLKLNGDRLIQALKNKETIGLVKTDKDVLHHILETLSEDVVAEIFVTNKYAPKEAVAKYPLAFAEKFIEHSFNPGTEGILDLCALSTSTKMDDTILKLIKNFNTNKYDGGFIRTMLNISSADEDLILSNSIGFLIENSSVSVIFLNEIKDSDLELFFRILPGLAPKQQKEAIYLLNFDNVKFDFKNKGVLVTALKLIIEYGRIDFLASYAGCKAFLPLLSDPSTNSKINDEEAMYIIEQATSNNYYSPEIIYRPIYENMGANVRNIGKYLIGVSRDSKYFFTSFSNGATKVSAAEAVDLVIGARTKLLKSCFKSGTDPEIAEAIKARTEEFIELIKSTMITPAYFRDEIPYDRPLLAAALYGMLTSEYRKQIATKYPELRSVRRTVSEKHQEIIDLIDEAKGSEFKEAIALYGDTPGVEVGLKAFLDRHSQTSYRQKYDRFRIYTSFLANLNDEKLVMSLLLPKVIGLGNYHDDKMRFLSAANAFTLFKEGIEDVNFALKYTYEEEKFLDLLPMEALQDISSSEESATLAYSAKLLAAKIRKISNTKKIKIDNDDLFLKVATLLPKEIALKKLDIDIFAFNDHYKLVFENGETFTAEEILKLGRETTNVHKVVESLIHIGAKKDLKIVADAILAKDTKEYNRLFPNGKRRDSDLREDASRALLLSNTDLINIEEMLTESDHLPSFKDRLGEKYIEILLSKAPETKHTLRLSEYNHIKEFEIELLTKKYNLILPQFGVRENDEDLKELKAYLEHGVQVERVNFEVYLYGKEKLSDKAQKIALAIRDLKKTHPSIELDFGGCILHVARIKGCEDVLGTVSLENIIEDTDGVGDIELIHELGLPVSDSQALAEIIAKDTECLEYAIKNEMRFNDIIVSLNEYEYSRAADYRKDAKKIGIIIVTEEVASLNKIENHIFDSDGNIRDFEPISLTNLSMSLRVELVKQLIRKNPKYKKLLGQDMSAEDFVLMPPNLLEKSLLTIANFKDILGFGVPGDLSKEEKQDLADIIAAMGSLMAIAAQNIKKFIGLAGLTDIKFDDIFVRQDNKIAVGPFAKFIATKYEHVDNVGNLFSTVIKNPSKTEMFALVLGADGEYAMDLFTDAARSLAHVKQEMNTFTALLDDDEITPTLIFEAMAGDAASNAILDERMKKGDEAAEMLSALSGVVKNTTVHISIARKQLKAGEPAELANILHDRIGELVSATRKIVCEKGEAKRRKMKLGFSHFNELLQQSEMAISSKRDKDTYSLYFPVDLGEVKTIGQNHGWCTSYNDSYFDNTVDGSAILFNIKNSKNKIVAQGYVNRRGNDFVLNQLRYASNTNAERDFDFPAILSILKTLIAKDSKLKERYS